MAFTYLKIKSAKCLCLLPVVLVLVLRIRSCLHNCAEKNVLRQCVFTPPVSVGPYIWQADSSAQGVLLYDIAAIKNDNNNYYKLHSEQDRMSSYHIFV